jgi:hypothetical protein
MIHILLILIIASISQGGCPYDNHLPSPSTPSTLDNTDPLSRANLYLSKITYPGNGDLYFPRVFIMYRWISLDLYKDGQLISTRIIVNQTFNDLKKVAHLPVIVMNVLISCCSAQINACA